MEIKLLRRLKTSIQIRKLKYLLKKNSTRRNKQLINHDFTIISNNCWGGLVYQSYNIPYKTPTIGLYFFSEDYILFLKNLEYYLSLDLVFIEPKESKHYSELLKKHNNIKFPIGILGDIEIMFMHYSTEEEAYEKWSKRVNRINWDKLIVKFNNQNNFRKSLAKEFEELTYENKIFFTSVNDNLSSSEIYIEESQGQKEILIEQEPILSNKYINITKIINSL